MYICNRACAHAQHTHIYIPAIGGARGNTMQGTTRGNNSFQIITILFRPHRPICLFTVKTSITNQSNINKNHRYFPDSVCLETEGRNTSKTLAKPKKGW